MPARDSGEPAAVRFWRLVDVQSPDKCWPWLAAKKSGYGRFTTDVRRESDGKFKQVGAHRFSYELEHGPIPAGLMVCHECDNPGCVNPRHLFVGTACENKRDQVAKGRHPDVKGERNGRARLTAVDVRAIRPMRGVLPARVVASMYDASLQSIYDIWQGRTWREVE